MAAGRHAHSSRKWSVRFLSPGWTLQLYSPATNTNASAALILAASVVSAGGASPGAYSLYMRSSMGRSSALASISSGSAPRAAKADTRWLASLTPCRSRR